MRIEFRVFGNPKGQPRPRATAFLHNGRACSRVYSPADSGNGSGDVRAWRDAVYLACRQAMAKHPEAWPIREPITMTITCLFPRPKHLLKPRSDPARLKMAQKPDWDNVGKTSDAITEAGLWADDKQVWDGRVVKYYVAIGEAPGAEIVIEW